MSTKKPAEALGVDVFSRVEAAHPAQVKFHNVPSEHVLKGNEPRVALVRADDLWVEEHLAEAPNWVLASRVIGDDRGVPVISEIRIFPAPSEDDQYRAPGEWAAQIIGSRARPIPRGGISASTLRKAAAVAIKRHAKTAAVLRWTRTLGKLPHRDGAFGIIAKTIASAGISAKNPFDSVRQQKKGSSDGPLRRGRPVKWSPADYARIALTYDDAVRAGASPIQAVMKVHRLGHAQARNLIARARSSGHKFIREAPKQGQAAEPLSDTEREWLRKVVADASKATKG